MAHRTVIMVLACWTGLATAGPQDILARYTGEVAGATPGWPASSRLPRCTTCHGTDLSQPGRHAITGKAIAAMLPTAAPRRLTDFRKTEKWFRRNCKEVVGRECTAREKADVVKYLIEGGRT
jgi:cytochrome c553